MLRALYPDVFTTATADNRPVTERIKTFEDACKELGEEHPFVKEWNYGQGCCSVDLAAYLKARIIVAALNEGWIPDWRNKVQRKWYPWFYILTEQEYNALEEDAKCRVVLRSGNNASAYSGLACAVAGSACSYSYTVCGARLAFKTKELAEYCAKQFGELWAAFLLG